MEWQEAVDKIKPFVVRISTPNGSGTGFLISRSSLSPICAIATAAHVVGDAYRWELPIRIDHYQSSKTLLLHHSERKIIVRDTTDTAAILINKSNLLLPDEQPTLITEGKSIRVGVEVGWLGFPAVWPHDLCFFSGRVSAYSNDNNAYVIDGVAINGVSGGPTLYIVGDNVYVMGVVTEYIVNRATGEALPGLSLVRDVGQFQELVKELRTIDEAQKERRKFSELTGLPPLSSTRS